MGRKALSLSRRIYQDLLGMIASGQLNSGDALPTEKELQQRYGVSRAPVRQALGRLEAEGRIRRTPGRGSEVIHPRLASWVRLSGFAHYYSRVADKVASRTLSVQTVPAEIQVASHFGLDTGAPILQIRRLRLVGGDPVAYMVNFFNFGLGVDLPDYDGEFFTMQDFLKQNLQRSEAEVEEDLVADSASLEVAELLQVHPDTPLLLVTRQGWDQDRCPVEISRYWVRTDVMSYRVSLSWEKAGG